MRSREDDALAGPDFPDDAAIQTRVRDALSWNDRPRGTLITVRVHETRVTLEGHVHSEEQKKLASEVANGVWGVGAVANNLRVEERREAD
jgi:osmotically-inducible protein OsmY